MTKEDELTAGLQAELARVNARLAEVKRPQNCGTGYCSCVECVVEPALVQQPATLDEMHAIGNGIMYGEQPAPVKTYSGGKPWPVAPKPWVGLTKDDVESWDLPVNPTVFEFAQFIEAKLREKNGGAA
jgi:hypothetical protein